MFKAWTGFAVVLLMLTGFARTASAQDDDPATPPVEFQAAPGGAMADAGAAKAKAEDKADPKSKKPGKDAKDAKDDPEEEEVQPPEDRHGEVKNIGFRVTGVNKIDVVKEVWEVEGILTIASKTRLRKCDKPALQELFPSGTVTKADEANEYEDKGLEVRECKVTIEEQTEINVARYPFDSHDLELEVGDEGESIDGVEFKPSPDAEDTSVAANVRLAGWELGPWTAEQVKGTDEHTKAQTTKVVFTLHAKRPLFSSFVKGFLAVVFQLLIALVALVLAVKAAPNRLALATGALIAVATAHNQVSSQVGVSYLTTADKFFFLCYFLLLTNVVFTALMIRAEDAKNDARIKRLWNTSAVVLPLITLVGSVLVLTGIV